MIHLLLQYNANINVKNFEGQTPIMLAACCNHEVSFVFYHTIID